MSVSSIRLMGGFMSARNFKGLSRHANAAIAALTLNAFAASFAHAVPVDWTTWTSTTSNTVSGSVLSGSTLVDVTYSGAQYSFAQINGVGTNYWSPTTPYISSTVSNAPTPVDLVALNAAGTSTITFSTAVVNPLIALVSWNGANVTFGGGSDSQTYNIQYLSSGCGYWGCGSFASSTSNSFLGLGELHGVIELLGTYTTISFTDTTAENWHGLTVGFEGVAVTAVPEPSVAWLMLAGLPIFAALARRRRRTTA
jgi:hypothetical protein